MAALSSEPDFNTSLRQFRNLLLIALGAILAFELLWFFDIRWFDRAGQIPVPLRLFNVGATLSAICAAYFIRFGRHWRWWVLGFCTLVIASFTIIALLTGDNAPLAVALFVVVLDAAVLVPWGVRFQTYLGLIGLESFAVVVAAGTVESSDIPRWIRIGVTTAFCVSFAALKDYSNRQKALVGELQARENSFRAESARRSHVEELLRIEVADREAAETLARKRESTLRKVLSTSIDVITIHAVSDNREIYTNDDGHSTGFRPQEVQGQTQKIPNSWADLAQFAEFQAKLKETGRVNNMEANFRQKSGDSISCLISAVVVDLEGERCVVSMARDITKRKNMERDLIAAREDALAASRAKSEFLSSMSHEIRTPMNAVLGMADLLTETILTQEQRRYLEVMVANGNSLLDLINSILDLARIESGRMQIEKIEFDLADLIDKTISTFGVQAHSKGLELVARIAPGVPEHLIGDPLRLRQILMNFLGNAIKFTEKGEVVLDVDRDEQSSEPAALRFSVSDTGIGIPPAKLQSIFSTFTQADSSTTRKYGGTGLGLAIAQRLVGLMDGRLWVESELSRGSKFSFTSNFGLASRVISPTSHVVLSLSGYRVLVVDDNHINRLIAREMISNCGAEVSEVGSGEEALVAIGHAADAGRPYRIVLLDMRMPGMNGLEVAKRIRAQHLPTEPLILMLSSDDLQPQLSGLQDLGLDAYLVKPITRKELFEAISRVIQDANLGSADTLPDRAASGPEDTAVARDTRILIADDSADNRLLIDAYLRREPYQLDIAEDGKIAFEKFTTNQYDMVFMDVQMPEIDGLTTTRMIREWEHEQGRAPTPIIALTASALEEDVQRALAAGCNLHVSKPIKKRVLLDTIQKVILLSKAQFSVTPDLIENLETAVDLRTSECSTSGGHARGFQ